MDSNKRWIVILNGGKGRPCFLVDENEEACLFNSEKDAHNTASKNGLGKSRGYEVISWLYFEE